jgi:hypothetical protein
MSSAARKIANIITFIIFYFVFEILKAYWAANKNVNLVFGFPFINLIIQLKIQMILQRFRSISVQKFNIMMKNCYLSRSILPMEPFVPYIFLICLVNRQLSMVWSTINIAFIWISICFECIRELK